MAVAVTVSEVVDEGPVDVAVPVLLLEPPAPELLDVVARARPRGERSRERPAEEACHFARRDGAVRLAEGHVAVGTARLRDAGKTTTRGARDESSQRDRFRRGSRERAWVSTRRCRGSGGGDGAAPLRPCRRGLACRTLSR